VLRYFAHVAARIPFFRRPISCPTKNPLHNITTWKPSFFSFSSFQFYYWCVASAFEHQFVRNLTPFSGGNIEDFWRSFLEPLLSLFSTTFSACRQCHSLGTVIFIWQKSLLVSFDTHTPHTERGACDSHGHDRKPACLTNHQKKADCSYGDGEGQKIPTEPQGGKYSSKHRVMERKLHPPDAPADQNANLIASDRSDRSTKCARKSGMCEEHDCRLRCVMNQRRSLVVSLMSLCTVSGTRSYGILWYRYPWITIPVPGTIWFRYSIKKRKSLEIIYSVYFHRATSIIITVILFPATQHTKSTRFVFEDLRTWTTIGTLSGFLY
jgi:hypothetical protein